MSHRVSEGTEGFIRPQFLINFLIIAHFFNLFFNYDKNLEVASFLPFFSLGFLLINFLSSECLFAEINSGGVTFMKLVNLMLLFFCQLFCSNFSGHSFSLSMSLSSFLMSLLLFPL